MSLLSLLIYIAKGGYLRRGYSQRSPDDAACLELFCRLLLGVEDQCPVELSTALEQGIQLVWEDVYDYVNPFGDRRGDIFSSVWTFDLNNDMLLLEKKQGIFSAPLRLAREGLLTLESFDTMKPSPRPSLLECRHPGPYWEPEICPWPRKRAFLERLLGDFGHTWRHILRRSMNSACFIKLAYAVIWISTLDFSITERTGFDHISIGGPYVQLIDLPSWKTPQETLFQAGSSWVVLAQDTREGLEMVRRHLNSQTPKDPTPKVITYLILTLRYVVLCRAKGSGLEWTKAEVLFDDAIPTSTAAIEMIIWATSTEPPETTLNFLPVEIQDRILHYAAGSSVASAKLGCELGLGSPFSWTDGGVSIRVEVTKTHRFESSPVESQIFLNGIMSGLSYKRERGYQAIPSGELLLPSEMPRNRKLRSS